MNLTKLAAIFTAIAWAALAVLAFAEAYRGADSSWKNEPPIVWAIGKSEGCCEFSYLYVEDVDTGKLAWGRGLGGEDAVMFHNQYVARAMMEHVASIAEVDPEKLEYIGYNRKTGEEVVPD